MKVSFLLPHEPNVVWTEEATKNLIGQTPKLAGKKTEILDSKLTKDGIELTIEIDPPFSLTELRNDYSIKTD